MSDLRWPAQDRLVRIDRVIAATIFNLAQVIISVVVVIFQPPIKITLAGDQGDILDQLHVEGTHGTISPGIGAESAASVMGERRDN